MQNALIPTSYICIYISTQTVHLLLSITFRITFFRCPINLQQISGVRVAHAECLDPRLEFGDVVQLVVNLKVVLEAMPNQFNGVKVRTCSRSVEPVDTFLAVPPLSITAGTFRIIILLKPVTIWIIGFQEWK